MIIMSALRMIMVILICLPVGYLLYVLSGDLIDEVTGKTVNKNSKKRNVVDGKKRPVYNSRRTGRSR